MKIITHVNGISQIYSPLYLSRLDNSDSTSIPLQIRIASKANLVFVAYGFGGIKVLDQLGQSIIFAYTLDQSYVESIDVSSDGKYIFIGMKSKIAIFQYLVESTGSTQIQSFTHISEDSFPTDVSNIVYCEMSELVVAAGRDGYVVVYATNDKNKISLLTQFNTGSFTINNLKISQDCKWVYIASDLQGIFVLKLTESQVNNQRHIQIIQAAGGIGGIRSFDIAATIDNQYIYAIDFWYGFFIANVGKGVMDQEENYPIQLSFQEYWPFKQMSPTCQKIIISKDDNYLFLGVRSQGILIFDNTVKDKVIFFQQIKEDSLAQSIALSNTENYLYFSNADSVFTFQKTIPYLNDKNPNLFNVHQAKQFPIQGRFKWRCYIDSTNQYILGAFDIEGSFVFQFHNDPYKLNQIKYQSLGVMTDSVDIDQEGIYMFVPQYFSMELLLIYQIQPLNDSDEEQKISMYNPKLVSQVSLNQVQITEVIVFSRDRQYAVQAYATGILLYNSTNIFDFKVLFYWKNLEFMIGENQGVAITADNKWILSTIRLFGMYVLNAEDKTNLVLADYIITQGGESIWMSQIYNDYAYLIDGIKGFAIIYLAKLPKISILARVSLPGWCVMGLLLQDDSFILISQMENGMLTLLDIKDKQNPYVVSTFRYGKQFAGGICMPKSEEYLFIGSPQGMITLPLNSRVKIHTDMSEIITDQITGLESIYKLSINQLVQAEQSDFTFNVGQKILFSFLILYPEDEDMQIVSVQKYQDQMIIDLPSYMEYDVSSQSLTFDVDKSALGNERINANLNTILLKTIIPLQENSFEYSFQDDEDIAITNLIQSTMILNYLIDTNILDSKRMVTFNFDYSKILKFNQEFTQQLINSSALDFTLISPSDYIAQVSDKTTVTVMKSFYINPITFYVESSLSINFNNSSAYIFSLSQDYLSINLQIPKEKGKFVPHYYPSIQTSLSELQDEIKLQGSLDNINKSLLSGIIFSNSTEFYNDESSNSYNITITLMDNQNYPLVINQPIQKCNFVKLKPRIILSQNQTLQKQINNQFQGAVLYIDSDVLITFSQYTFLNVESNLIKYQIQYSQSNTVDTDFKDLTPDVWLQTQGDDRLIFKGTIKTQYYGSTYYFKVIADDGYTQACDYFYVKLNGISFIYVMNIMLQILGPLFALLGIYKKRYVFLNMIFRQRVMYTDVIATCDDVFKKRIVILGSINNDSRIIVSQLFSQINKISSLNGIQNSNALQELQPLEFDATSEMKEDIKEESQYDDIFGNIQKEISQNTYKDKLDNKIIDILLKTPTHVKQKNSEKRYLQKYGQIVISQIIKDILALNISNLIAIKLKWQHDYISDLKNIHSRIYRGVKAYAAKFLLQQDKKSHLVYNYIKFYCINNLKHSQNDWYKAVLNINLDESQNNQQQIFPELELKYEVINQIFSNIKLVDGSTITYSPQKQQIDQIQRFYKKGINISLIREVIFADAFGFSIQSPSIFQPCKGESIHLHTYEIKQIIAFKKINYSRWIKPLCQFFNLEYTQYGLSKNMKLPKWLDLDFKHGMITFTGTPQAEDIDEVLIRIYDITQYVIMQFYLKVQPNHNQFVEFSQNEEYLSNSSMNLLNQGKDMSNIDQKLATYNLAYKEIPFIKQSFFPEKTFINIQICNRENYDLDHSSIERKQIITSQKHENKNFLSKYQSKVQSNSKNQDIIQQGSDNYHFIDSQPIKQNKSVSKNFLSKGNDEIIEIY